MINQEPLTIATRSVHIPIHLRNQRLVSRLIALAQAIADNNTERIAALDDEIDRIASVVEVSSPGVENPISPTLRTKVLGAVLVDLWRGGWSVCVQNSQIFVSAPQWRLSKGLSPQEISEEKEKIRDTMAARVQEELESPSTRRFILSMERPRPASTGARSVLSLIADGRALAASLRTEGPEAIKPYLQPADISVGRDPDTGHLYSDIFRYFRYFWSFPMGSTPGRTMNFLLRDAGQPNHPVCALLSIASPVPKLSVRDEALGWSAAWLEAIVIALDLDSESPREYLRALGESWRSSPLRESSADLFLDLAALLNLAPARDAEALSRHFLSLSKQQRILRLEGARRRLLDDLRGELTDALAAISFKDFPFTHEYALENPSKALARLENKKEGAHERWRNSRSSQNLNTVGSLRLEKNVLNDDQKILNASKDPLFVKKRITQAIDILRAWEEVMPVEGEHAGERLRRLVLGTGASARKLTEGSKVTRGLREALSLRQNRIVASQVVDLCVCGAVPPYGPLLMGKFAALAALSRDIAAAYHARYNGRASEITSQMAGRAFARPADLVALTTTSFYGVGSSQYERLSLPSSTGEVKWHFVGHSRGHGTLHFSRRTSMLMDELLYLETGQHLITSRFGEGPSERLRKIRDGLSRVGIDANELLQHGMPRIVYIAELANRATRPGMRNPPGAWRRIGPPLGQVVAHWRTRWLTQRLSAQDKVLSQVEAFKPDAALLSHRLRPIGSYLVKENPK